MPDPVPRFLRHRPSIPNSSSLGRVYGVIRQTWPLDADPARSAPDQLVVASRRSASDAADIARNEALALPRSGYHKPSRAWWGVEGDRFHRSWSRRRNRARPCSPWRPASSDWACSPSCGER